MYLTGQYIKNACWPIAVDPRESKNASVLKNLSKSYIINRLNLKVYMIISRSSKNKCNFSNAS